MKEFIKGRMMGGVYALKGAIILLKTEASIQVQFALGLLLTYAGFHYNISKTEWMFQILAIGLVISVEALNTAVEEIADFIHPNFHVKIGLIKDIAAGAVFIAAITAMTIGGFIYIPKIF